MGLLRTIAQAIEREYDRRIRRASLVVEYGVQHHDHEDEAAHTEEAAREPAVAGEAEIVNVPRGTAVGQPSHAAESHSPARRE